jgi:hypothetical protein
MRASAGSEERVSTEPIGRSFVRARANVGDPAATTGQAGPPADVCLDFVRFCYRRRRVAWPALYDEMAAVAARGVFNGLSFAELAERGVTFSLSDLPRFAALTEQVMLEDRTSPEPYQPPDAQPSQAHPAERGAQPNPAFVMAPARS